MMDGVGKKEELRDRKKMKKERSQIKEWWTKNGNKEMLEGV